ncbi:MAG: nitroreductase family protein [Candidatus Nanohaloarchaea archaeon]
MSIFEDITSLGTFRDCEDKPIPRKLMGMILEAGSNAPSPGNVDALEFIVVEDDEKREALARITGDDRIESAPDSVIIIEDYERMARRVEEDKCRDFCSAEAAVAAQNMRLVAKENGLASCWVGGFPEQAVQDEFGIPDGKIPMGVVILGYSDDSVPEEEKFKLNNICYYDFYDNQVTSMFDQVEWKGIREEKRIYGKKSSGLVSRFRRKLREIL